MNPIKKQTNLRIRRVAAILVAGQMTWSAGALSAPTPAKPAVKKPAAVVKVVPKPAPGAVVKPAVGSPGAPMSAPGAVPAPPVRMVVSAPGAPAGTIRLDFRGTNIDTVLQAYAMAFKWTVVKDPACTGEVTVIETQPMDQKRALGVLLALLEVRGFTASLEDNILKVQTVKRAVSSSTTVRVARPMDETAGGSEVIRQVIPLSNAEAASLAKDLAPLINEGASIIGLAGANALIITDTASNIAALRQIINALDKGAGNNGWEIFHLKHVPAKKMVEIITELFKQIAPRTPPPPMGNPNQPQPPQQPGARADVRGAVAAVDDERTNSVIVVGSEENLKRVSELVKQLDEGLNPHAETKVYEVKFADSLKLAQMLNDALVGGTGSSPSAQPAGFNPFNPFGGRQQPQAVNAFTAGQTKIVADTRTNKLIITADEDTMKKVEELLEQLDQKVEYSTTTFAIKLKNAHAEDMAFVLAQAFGTNNQNGFNPFFRFFGGFGGDTSRGARRDRRIERREGSDQNQRSDAGFGPGGIAQPQTGFIPEPDAGKRYADGSFRPELPEGAQQLAQFYYDPFGRGRGGNTEATTGRTTGGQYVNLLQLRGNVLVTPERNTNSLIITTSPENEAAVRDLISDLDVEVKQVLLEALVVEVTLDKQVKFGIDYLFENLKDKFEGVFPVLPPTGPLGGIGGDPLTSGLRGTIMRGDFRAIISAVGRDDRVRILSTPSIFTANNQEAEIDVTDRIPYLKGTTVGFGGQTTSNVDFEEVGLILNVTPRITADGMVRVDVYQEDSNLVEFRNVGTGAVAPLTTQRVTDTSVTLRDGDTLVLSGLQKTSRLNIRHKIPVLGDIPLLGNLFRSTNKRDTKTELIVFLTPRVVNNADEAKSISDKELNRVQKKAPEAMPRVPSADRM